MPGTNTSQLRKQVLGYLSLDYQTPQKYLWYLIFSALLPPKLFFMETPKLILFVQQWHSKIFFMTLITRSGTIAGWPGFCHPFQEESRFRLQVTTLFWHNLHLSVQIIFALIIFTLFVGNKGYIRSLSKTVNIVFLIIFLFIINRRVHIRHHCRKTIDISCHRCVGKKWTTFKCRRELWPPDVSK